MHSSEQKVVIEIDPVKYGTYIESVETLKREMVAVKSDISAITRDIRGLLEIANKGQGGMLVLVVAVSAVSSVVSLLARWLIP